MLLCCVEFFPVHFALNNRRVKLEFRSLIAVSKQMDNATEGKKVGLSASTCPSTALNCRSTASRVLRTRQTSMSAPPPSTEDSPLFLRRYVSPIITTSCTPPKTVALPPTTHAELHSSAGVLLRTGKTPIWKFGNDSKPCAYFPWELVPRPSHPQPQHHQHPHFPHSFRLNFSNPHRWEHSRRCLLIFEPRGHQMPTSASPDI